MVPRIRRVITPGNSDVEMKNGHGLKPRRFVLYIGVLFEPYTWYVVRREMTFPVTLGLVVPRFL